MARALESERRTGPSGPIVVRVTFRGWGWMLGEGGRLVVGEGARAGRALSILKSSQG